MSGPIRQYDFVSKLSEGKLSSSPKACWWARHEMASTRYLLTVMTGKKKEVKKAQDNLFNGCIQWEIQHKEGSGLMAEHASLEIGFLNSVEEADAEAIEFMGTLLIENAISQAKELSQKIEEFPENMYLRLLQEHVSLMAICAQSVIEKDKAAFQSCEERRFRNALSLAEVTVEWL